MKFKNLLVVFVIVLGAFIIYWMFGKDKGESTLRSDIVEVDTSLITGMNLYPIANSFQELKFYKDGENWMINNDGAIVLADNNIIKSMLIELDGLKPQRLVSKTKEKWEKYEVTDSLGTRVEIESDGNVVSNFILGKFDYNQETRVATNYVRVIGEDNVYVTKGYASMSFNREANSFRNRSLIDVDNLGWNKVTYNYPGDSSFVLTKNNDYWLIDGLMTDSMAAANYISSLSRLGGSAFVDDFNASLSQPLFSIVIEGANASPITLEAFADFNSEDFVIISSENKDGKFSGSEGDVFSRVFVGRSKFQPRI